MLYLNSKFDKDGNAIHVYMTTDGRIVETR